MKLVYSDSILKADIWKCSHRHINLWAKTTLSTKKNSVPHIKQEGVERNGLECGPYYMLLNPSSATYWMCNLREAT